MTIEDAALKRKITTQNIYSIVLGVLLSPFYLIMIRTIPNEPEYLPKAYLLLIFGMPFIVIAILIFSRMFHSLKLAEFGVLLPLAPIVMIVISGVLVYGF